MAAPGGRFDFRAFDTASERREVEYPADLAVERTPVLVPQEPGLHAADARTVTRCRPTLLKVLPPEQQPVARSGGKIGWQVSPPPSGLTTGRRGRQTEKQPIGGSFRDGAAQESNLPSRGLHDLTVLKIARF